MNEIFKYSDYRDYLTDFYKSQKAVKSSFTYRYLAEKAGINSSGYFKQIMEGKRNLTNATIIKTCIALGLNTQEAEFFENLVHFNQTKSLKEKNRYFSVMLEVLNQRHNNKIPEDKYDYFSEWYHCAIRELVCVIDFNDDYGKLGKMLIPAISAKKVKDSILLLLKLGFIKKQGNRYIQAEPVITTGYDIKAHQVINFQIKMLKLAIDAFEQFHQDDLLHTSSTTFKLSRKSYMLFVKKIRGLKEELLRLEQEENDVDEVYQLNVNLFPLTKVRKRRKKNA
ncbi:MAG: TIGR02147 family protein [Fibrobacteria bacterium]|nr:TIGR02147 family protein [Fibrobacteria bacterium]